MFKNTILQLILATIITSGAVYAAKNTEVLEMEIYNPGEKSIFPVSSEIISGKTEAVLIDAQFQRNDAENLVKKIQQSGKKLTTIYISHSDPDFYFGLDVITAAFPKAKVITTPQTITEIQKTKQGKVAYWGAILKENAPKVIVIPEPLQGDNFTVDGQKIEIKGLNGPTPERTFVWIPTLRAAIGGVAVSGNIHLWAADTQTIESRKNWLKTLDKITALKPAIVVPGHFLDNAPLTLASVTFTKKYLTTLNAEIAKAKNSSELITAMKKIYPNLKDESSLKLSAKVL